VKYRLLGRVEMSGPRKVDIGGAKHRILLATLLFGANEFQSVDDIAEALWEHERLQSAHALVRLYVHQLRKRMGDAGADLLTEPGGYVLRVGPSELDLEVFRRETDQAHALMAVGDHAAAEVRYRAALALWHEPFVCRTESPTLDRLHGPWLEDMAVSAVEGLAEAQLALGRTLSLAGRLRPLVDRHPFRERLIGQYMLALHRSGRRVEALETFRRVRSLFVAELGIEPGHELRELMQTVLRDERGPYPAGPRPVSLAAAG
jgi:DNA-binding SARP family transcriptional activator